MSPKCRVTPSEIENYQINGKEVNGLAAMDVDKSSPLSVRAKGTKETCSTRASIRDGSKETGSTCAETCAQSPSGSPTPTELEFCSKEDSSLFGSNNSNKNSSLFGSNNSNKNDSSSCGTKERKERLESLAKKLEPLAKNDYKKVEIEKKLSDRSVEIDITMIANEEAQSSAKRDYKNTEKKAKEEAEDNVNVVNEQATLEVWPPRPKCQKKDVDFRNDWQLDEKIYAEGTSSMVHRVTRKGACTLSTSKKAAVIKIARPGKEAELSKEAKFLAHIGKHPHVVELMGFYHSDKYGTALVLEELSAGEVLKLVDMDCSEMDIRVVTAQVCQALGFVHSCGVVHRDVKAENVVMTGRGAEVKLADFGLSCFEDDEKAMMLRCGSPGYVAPEVITGDRSSFVVDTFALGVLIYLLIAGRLPFQGKTPTEILTKTLVCHVKFTDRVWNELTDCQSLVASLIVKDPKTRPAAIEVWRHPWFACIRPVSTSTNETTGKEVKPMPAAGPGTGKQCTNRNTEILLSKGTVEPSMNKVLSQIEEMSLHGEPVSPLSVDDSPLYGA